MSATIRRGPLSLQTPCFIPQRQLYPVPHPQLVVDHAQIVLHHVFGGSDRYGDLFVLQASGNQGDNSLLSVGWPAGSVEVD